MNFIDKKIQNTCQDEPVADPLVMAVQDMKRGAQMLMQASEDARNRDALCELLIDLNLIRVATNIVTQRVECREAAE